MPNQKPRIFNRTPAIEAAKNAIQREGLMASPVRSNMAPQRLRPGKFVLPQVSTQTSRFFATLVVERHVSGGDQSIELSGQGTRGLASRSARAMGSRLCRQKCDQVRPSSLDRPLYFFAAALGSPVGGGA